MKAQRRIGTIQIAAIMAVSIVLLLASCKPTTPWAQSGQAVPRTSGSEPSQSIKNDGVVHSLSFDESFGGHTLKRHVGRTDQQLEERLRQEPGISAASTYTDRATAEAVVADALRANEEKVAHWLERNKHSNLVLDYDGEHPVGRTLRRGEKNAQPCSHAIVVLHWDGPNEYHVLTSYPECRS